jgi:hypothetical protein
LSRTRKKPKKLAQPSGNLINHNGKPRKSSSARKLAKRKKRSLENPAKKPNRHLQARNLRDPGKSSLTLSKYSRLYGRSEDVVGVELVVEIEVVVDAEAEAEGVKVDEEGEVVLAVDGVARHRLLTWPILRLSRPLARISELLANIA